MPSLRPLLLCLLLLALSTATATAAPATDPITIARQAIEDGDRLYGQGRVVAACRQYELAVDVAPEWWYSAYKKALCDMSRGNYRDAFYLLTRARASRTGLYVLHITLARWHRLKGSPEEAQAEYERAIALTKGAVEPMVELADLLLQQDRAGEARLVLKRAEYFSPLNLAVRARLASVSERLHHLADAEEQLRYLARRGVNQRRNLAQLALFYQRHQNQEAAQAVLRLLKPGREEGFALPPPMAEFPAEANRE